MKVPIPFSNRSLAIAVHLGRHHERLGLRPFHGAFTINTKRLRVRLRTVNNEPSLNRVALRCLTHGDTLTRRERERMELACADLGHYTRDLDDASLSALTYNNT